MLTHTLPFPNVNKSPTPFPQHSITTKIIKMGNSTIETFRLVGHNNFIRKNPKSDAFPTHKFHHIEFYTSDATNTCLRFSHGLGMPLVAKSDLSTGNSVHASYLLRSGNLRFLFTAPYSPTISIPNSASVPSFELLKHRDFVSSHGLAVRAVAVEVDSAFTAFDVAVSRGAIPVFNPVLLCDGKTGLAEVKLYGDVVLRLVSFEENGESGFFLPGFDESVGNHDLDYGIRRLDHAVGNVPELGPVVEYLKGFTGFHEFAEFTSEDVGTGESGLNSVVLANNEENVLLPLNEPVFGTKRKSQIQTFLEHNEGPGLQHLALVSEDIFRTLREMRKRSGIGGFEFMPAPPETYYRKLKGRVGDVLSDEQVKECEELGILVDRDDQGTLLQIFTKPVGDRPTIFIEIIQRVGCMLKDEQGQVYQKGGCGGFGKGNFSELFKSIEEYEKMLEAKQFQDSAILGQEMAEQSMISQKHEQGKMILPNLRMDPTKAPSRSSGSVPSSPNGPRKPSSLRPNCLCSPTTHVGSFRCRYHRNANLTRNSLSLGAKLSDLGEKQTEMCRAFQGQLITGHNQGS